MRTISTIPEPQSIDDYNGRISLRIPKSLHKNIIEVAKVEGVSANQYLNHLISTGMGKRIRSLKPAGFCRRNIVINVELSWQGGGSHANWQKSTGRMAG